MPGTLVRDANASNLLTGATVNSAGTTTSTAVQVDRPGKVTVRLDTSTVTGTNPTLSIVVQGSDVSGFGSGVVSYGTITLLSGDATSQTGVTKQLNAYIYKKYVRLSVTCGGTSPVYTNSTVYLEQEHYKRSGSESSAV